ncbi:TetR/AcrR family transcriptional regulator [Nonomuraea africana]|uniref:DNA-binding transcriptional regulator YbjK n=1 Tax=Nonomuraea africana TaxID=46171 RepID=A0ABR9KJM0_9ACTN|nr:TetR family transcriptional regulator [Nonomuraea africana]MBE1562214.1 DNA-binding transcriptional regulator YbjK [Nonomuraea africana]
MPRESDRRELLADTAMRLIDEVGLAGVTHRAIDAAAGVPVGTTSNYFRTRAALYEAIAHRILDQQLAALQAAPVTPMDRDSLIDSLTAAIDAGDGPARNRYLARFELSLEAARNARLAALMRELRAVTLRIRTAQLRAIHPEATHEQLDALGSLLTGVTFDRLTLGVPGMDTRALVETLIAGFLLAADEPLEK